MKEGFEKGSRKWVEKARQRGQHVQDRVNQLAGDHLASNYEEGKEKVGMENMGNEQGNFSFT